MITSFSPKTIESLQHYVYVYSDPDTHKPFYVGKGKGNRVFDHLTYENDSQKAAYIQQLHKNGKEPLIEILVHGVDEETAFKVEAAAIDLIGIENLTNQQRGHHSSTYGKIEVSLLESRYNCKELTMDDITDNIILIKVTQKYQNNMTSHELYEITRAYWKVSIEQAQKAKYALAIYDGMVLEVYEIAQWFPALSTIMAQREENPKDVEGRSEFVGKIAAEEIRRKYKDKSVSTLFARGAQNPIRYIFPED